MSGGCKPITLKATQTSRNIVFSAYASSFNKGIILQASGGVILSQSVTTIASDVVIRAGTAALRVIDKRELSTTNKFLTITADDIDLQGSYHYTI